MAASPVTRGRVVGVPGPAQLALRTVVVVVVVAMPGVRAMVFVLAGAGAVVGLVAQAGLVRLKRAVLAEVAAGVEVKAAGAVAVVVFGGHPHMLGQMSDTLRPETASTVPQDVGGKKTGEPHVGRSVIPRQCGVVGWPVTVLSSA